MVQNKLQYLKRRLKDKKIIVFNFHFTYHSLTTNNDPKIANMVQVNTASTSPLLNLKLNTLGE